MSNEVYQKLCDNLEKTHSVYSKFKVSCILVTSDGKLYNGQNIENSSYGATICAERVAMSNAFANGADLKEITEIHLMTSSEENYIPMCGICIQTLSDFVPADADVYLYLKNKDSPKALKFYDFITYSIDLKSFKLWFNAC